MYRYISYIKKLILLKLCIKWAIFRNGKRRFFVLNSAHLTTFAKFTLSNSLLETAWILYVLDITNKDSVHSIRLSTIFKPTLNSYSTFICKSLSRRKDLWGLWLNYFFIYCYVSSHGLEDNKQFCTNNPAVPW